MTTNGTVRSRIFRDKTGMVFFVAVPVRCETAAWGLPDCFGPDSRN